MFRINKYFITFYSSERVVIRNIIHRPCKDKCCTVKTQIVENLNSFIILILKLPSTPSLDFEMYTVGDGGNFFHKDELLWLGTEGNGAGC